MAVNLSGALLSALFYEHLNCNSDQEGFLFGQILSKVTDTISDSQLNTVKEETATNVLSFLPCPGLFSWYDSSGKVVQEKLCSLLPGKKNKEVIGWYKFRRHTSHQVSLREKEVHRNLMEAFPRVLPKHFLFCLCSMTSTANASTHTFDHVFLTYNNKGVLQGSPVTITNLGDTAHTDYIAQHKKNSKKRESEPVFSSYQQTMDKHIMNFQNKNGDMLAVQAINSLSLDLNKQLNSVASQLWESEDQIARLAKEVQQLQRQLPPKPLKLPDLPEKSKRSPSTGEATPITQHQSPPPLLQKTVRKLSRKPLPPLPPEAGQDEPEEADNLIVFMDEEPRTGQGVKSKKNRHDEPVVSNVDLLKDMTLSESEHVLTEKSHNERFSDETSGSSDSDDQSAENSADAFSFVSVLIDKEKSKAPTPSLSRSTSLPRDQQLAMLNEVPLSRSMDLTRVPVKRRSTRTRADAQKKQDNSQTDTSHKPERRKHTSQNNPILQPLKSSLSPQLHKKANRSDKEDILTGDETMDVEPSSSPQY